MGIISMSFFLTCCGFYCGLGALVAIYFFICLAIMEMRQNPYLVYNQNAGTSAESKSTAFFIAAAVEAVLVVACFACGYTSMQADASNALAEKREKMREFGIDPDQDGQMSQRQGAQRLPN